MRQFAEGKIAPALTFKSVVIFGVVRKLSSRSTKLWVEIPILVKFKSKLKS